ncbi:MAG TPA: HEAT repeat domain-containing protein [Candidatus Aminicenantes bacterium]|nr:HEAT repeat domain-containing protein [Candidatus Aminicenantes bacterium]HRY65310.1 HEAT repeat domain-containing protein [Candidatus Aminicenantes bacterium]HRZ72222.1 HEAT repeat domain-containing protein [Candidatus Aminicenantes bacterium]
MPPGQADTAAVARLDQARDLLHYLANTVSAMKIFPNEHATVTGFVDQLTAKFTDFLNAHQKLQIGIEEFAFTYEGKPAYTDEVAIKSLPFFFFKDGLQIIFFYQGLDRAEILEFLELIKSEAQKPTEDADIVVALWERDFPNIQYYAPDEYLENRILGETQEGREERIMPDLPGELAQEMIEVRVDASKLSQGRVELDREDRELVETASARSDEDGTDAPPGPPPGGDPANPPAEAKGPVSPAAAMDPTLTESELASLETMVRVNRTISPQEEYINLMVEILYLEADPANDRAALDTLLEYHFDRIQHGHFDIGVLVLQKIHELRRALAGDAAKAALLDDFLARTVSPKTVEAVKALLDQKKAMDWESLLGFFSLLGPPALDLAAELYDIAPDGQARHRIVEFLEKAGADRPGHLAGLADKTRPALAREIVGLLARLKEDRGIPHLAAFLNFPNREIKSEVLRLLGRSRNETAGRILAGFLNDPDEEIRIQAVLALDPAQGGARVRQILNEASAREFRAKSYKEKEALLSFLGRTRSPEALGFLERTLLHAPVLSPKAILETRLAAAAGLEAMATPEAAQALQKGALGRTRRVREACQAALMRLPPAGAARS